MTEIEFDCTTSKNLVPGSTFVHDACVIEIVSVIDTNHASVKVYPLYEGRIDLTLVEDQETNFRDFRVPFRITATTIYYGSTLRAVILKVCKLKEEIKPTPTPTPSPTPTPTPTPTPQPTPVIVCRKGCISGTFTYSTGRRIDGKCELIPNSPECGYLGFIKCQAYDSTSNKALYATVRIDGQTIAPKSPCTTQGLSPGSHTVTFIHAGYITKTVTVTVTSGQTVNAYGSMVKVTTPTPAPTPTPTPIPSKTGKIHCTTSPSGATIQIKDMSLAVPFFLNYGVTNKYYIELKAGTHVVKYTRTGYKDYETTISVVADKTMYVTATLRPLVTPTPTPTPSPTPTPTPVPSQMGKIHCLTNPLGADIYIKDLSLAVPFYLKYGISNLYNIELKEGRYSVKYSKTGYQDFITTVYVVAGETKYVSGQLTKVSTPTPTPTPVPTLKGTLNCATTPTGAAIHIKDLSLPVPFYLNYGVTNKYNIELDPGRYVVKLIKAGYDYSFATINIEAGKVVYVIKTLDPTTTPTPTPAPTPTPTPTPAPTPTPTPVPAEQGNIHCTTNPAGATIQIKDLSLLVPFYLNYGLTNKYYIPLDAGKYSVKYSKDGYNDAILTFTVVAGKTMYVPTNLSPTVTPTPTPTPVPATGYIRCQAYDSVTNAGLNATLRIDGNTIVPKTPHTTPALPIGTHKVTFIHEGYVTKDVTVTVRAGQTASAYGSMVKLALPDVTGFDVKVNIPGLLPKSSLHIQQVVKVPFTDTWWNAPLGHGMMWDNITTGVYKARGRSADSSPTPSFHTGFDENEDYVIYVGTSAVAFYPGSIIHRSTGKVTEIDLTSSYIDWVSSKVCAAMDITPANCPFFIASSVNDAAFFIELWSIITKHENLAGEHTLPTALDYALLPIAIFGMLSPGISEGKIVQTVGRRITELIPLSRKGTTEIKAVMQDPGIDTFLLRATETQFKDFVRYIDDGLHINAKNLLKTVDDAPLSGDDLHALQRAANFVEELDPKLIKAGSMESLKKVLTRFSDKFKNIFGNALNFARDNPKTAIGIGVLAIWFMIDNVPFYIYMYLKTKGRAPGDRSWQAKLYVDKIDQYKFNVINAEKIQDWDLFCSNLGLMEDAVDTLESYILANKSTLESEETYGIYEGTVQVYREAIKLKREVHTCAITLPEAINAEVIEILDSDTVRIRYDNKDYTVRLLGINAPEGSTYEYTCTGVKTPYLIRRLLTPGKECIEEETWTGTKEMYDASKVWLGQNLPVHQMAQFSSDSARQFDKYGRLLAIPFYNSKNVCMESLKAGQSVVFFYDYNKQVNSSAFLAAEQTAKDAKIGVWAVAEGVGSIRCVSNPTAAEVWLDGEYTGKKTISSVAYLYNIPVGEHTVEFKKIIDGVSHACSKTITVVKGVTALAECILISGVTPTPTSTPPITPTPTPTPEKAIWQIGDVKNEAGAVLGAAKVFVDDVYLAHYAPETLTFCTDCACDAVVPCGFGTHTVTIKKTGYEDWSKTRTLGPGDSFTDNPIMSAPAPGTFPVTFVSKPSGATIKVDGKAI